MPSYDYDHTNYSALGPSPRSHHAYCRGFLQDASVRVLLCTGHRPCHRRDNRFLHQQPEGQRQEGAFACIRQVCHYPLSGGGYIPNIMVIDTHFHAPSHSPNAALVSPDRIHIWPEMLLRRGKLAPEWTVSFPFCQIPSCLHVVSSAFMFSVTARALAGVMI